MLQRLESGVEACGLAVRKGLVRGMDDMNGAGVKGTSACIGARSVVSLGRYGHGLGK